MPDDLPANVVTTYGLTETMGGVVYDGRPLDGVEIRIVEDYLAFRRTGRVAPPRPLNPRPTP